MQRATILSELMEVFKETLDIEHIELQESSTAAEIEEWDSLSHIQLVVAIEKHFKIRFASSEIQQWKNVGEMISSILAKQS